MQLCLLGGSFIAYKQTRPHWHSPLTQVVCHIWCRSVCLERSVQLGISPICFEFTAMIRRNSDSSPLWVWTHILAPFSENKMDIWTPDTGKLSIHQTHLVIISGESCSGKLVCSAAATLKSVCNRHREIKCTVYCWPRSLQLSVKTGSQWTGCSGCTASRQSGLAGHLALTRQVRVTVAVLQQQKTAEKKERRQLVLSVSLVGLRFCVVCCFCCFLV